jgi:hypothetical protein
VAARLPFLLSHKIAFDADEAVEGLMARHVLHGEFPAFFWGQAFKGVPEVYFSAGAFAAFGPSVTVLKSVTLALFAAYVALNFVLLDRIAGRWTAVAASLLLIACPPALVFWSLDASAEYILLMLLGTMFLWLIVDGGQHQQGFARLGAIGLVVGLAFWVQQLFVIYVIPVAIVLAIANRPWRTRLTANAGAVTTIIAAVSALYLALGVAAFLTGGFVFSLGPVSLGARAPQKMLRIAFGAGALAVLLHVWRGTSSHERRGLMTRAWPLAAGLLAGYSPVILYSILVEPAHSPLRSAGLRQMIDAAPDIFGNIVPIILGFTLATTARLPISLAAAVPGIAALGAYAWAHRRVTGRNVADGFFPLFVFTTPLLFLLSGAYLDTQSYRYLIPYYAGLSVAWAGGCAAIGRLVAGRGTPQTLAASALLTVVLGIHVWQQVLWYRGLTPDTQSMAAIDCLHRAGIRGGSADYWTSYKLTFLSGEDIILAPSDGVDRYPAFTNFVRSLPENQHKVDECLASR